MKAIDITNKRKQLGLTQKKLAELIGVSTQTINGYENGKQIPETKTHILNAVLNKKNQIIDYPIYEEIIQIVSESEFLPIKISDSDKKIQERKSLISDFEEKIAIAKEANIDYSHDLKRLELNKEILEIMYLAKFNKQNDL